MVVTTIKVTEATTMITIPRSNLGIKVKSTKPQAYESKKEREQTY